MPDVEKVIKGLEACVDGECAKCDYGGTCSDAEDFVALARDALELLKAQEAVPPGKTEVWEGITYAGCGHCGNAVMKQYSYCPFCGRKVAWE